MAIKSDAWIKKMVREYDMIRPFSSRQIRTGISYGLSSYGYDFRVANEFQIFTGLNTREVDPKKPNSKSFTTLKSKSILIPPHSFALARTVEYFKIPRKILTLCVGKSTYARCGIIVNVTPFEPEWEGFATLELSNTSPLPVRVYANEGIAQLIFLESDEICEVSYADKKGKYQAQKKITPAKI
jgi:dCTP deaminase